MSITHKYVAQNITPDNRHKSVLQRKQYDTARPIMPLTSMPFSRDTDDRQHVGNKTQKSGAQAIPSE